MLVVFAIVILLISCYLCECIIVPKIHEEIINKIQNVIYPMKLDNNSTIVNNVIFLPITELGLANRLRTISSMSVIAHILHRKLIILWHKSIECNVNIHDLFTINN